MLREPIAAVLRLPDRQQPAGLRMDTDPEAIVLEDKPVVPAAAEQATREAAEQSAGGLLFRNDSRCRCRGGSRARGTGRADDPLFTGPRSRHRAHRQSGEHLPAGDDPLRFTAGRGDARGDRVGGGERFGRGNGPCGGVRLRSGDGIAVGLPGDELAGAGGAAEVFVGGDERSQGGRPGTDPAEVFEPRARHPGVVGELNDRGVLVVERVADPLGEVQNGRRPAGIEGGAGDPLQASAPGPFPADPTEPWIGEGSAVEEIPDHAGVVEVGEDLGEDRRPAAAELRKRDRHPPDRLLPRSVPLEERLADRFREEAVERFFVIPAACRGDPTGVARPPQPARQARVGAGKFLHDPPGRDDGQRYRGIELGGQPGPEGRLREEDEVDQPDIHRVVAGPGRLEVPEALAQSLSCRRRVSRFPGPGGGDDPLLEAGRRFIPRPASEGRRGAEPGRRPHPPGEQFGEEPGQAEGVEVGDAGLPGWGRGGGISRRGIAGRRSRRLGAGWERLGIGREAERGESLTNGCGPVAGPSYPTAAGRRGRVEPPDKPIVAGGCNDPQHLRVIPWGHLDARPRRHPPGRGDQTGVPGRGPCRQQFVGLGVSQPGGKIVERMAGEENDGPARCHGSRVYCRPPPFSGVVARRRIRVVFSPGEVTVGLTPCWNRS